MVRRRRRSYYYDDYSYFPSQKSKAERMADASKKRKSLEQSGAELSPVVLPGFAIATTLWGKSWCKNIESYQDYSNRLPRGRSYVRSGCVLDLQIERGVVYAQVMGSSLYKIKIEIAPLKQERWVALSTACAGKIGSLVELLQGRISDEVMSIMTDPANGLFPKPAEIKYKCSCPDFASLCKHLAAVLYGIGSRLDTQPELLFLLRGVDATDLIDQAVEIPAMVAESESALGDDELADVFGIEIDVVGGSTPQVAEESAKPTAPAPKRRGRPRKESPATQQAAPPQKRGRPRKEAAVAPTVTPAEPPKRRGRPKKSLVAATTTTPEVPPKRRGRPRKESLTPQAPPAVKPSGHRESNTTAKAAFGAAFDKQVHKLATSPAPAGRPRWTLNLLQQELVSRKIVPSVSLTTLHHTLKRLEIKLT